MAEPIADKDTRDAYAPIRSPEWAAVYDVLRDYHMPNMMGADDGTAYPLVDLMTRDGETIEDGEGVMVSLADEIVGALRAARPAPAAAPGVEGALHFVHDNAGSETRIFGTQAEALQFAQEAVEVASENAAADGEWENGADEIYVGIVTHRAALRQREDGAFDMEFGPLSATPTPPAQPVEGWPDMASAPRDRSVFLGYGRPIKSEPPTIRQTRWMPYHSSSIAGQKAARGEGPDGFWEWVDPDFTVVQEWRPTRWTPLPAPPTPASQDSQEGAEHGC